MSIKENEETDEMIDTLFEEYEFDEWTTESCSKCFDDNCYWSIDGLLVCTTCGFANKNHISIIIIDEEGKQI